MHTACLIEGATGPGQDRACVFKAGEATVFALADGAGGIGGGEAAADAWIAEVKAAVAEGISLTSVRPWTPRLLQLDRRLSGHGETTAVLAIVQPGRILGVSVGDSIGLILNAPGTTAPIHLTAKQHKARLGSGHVKVTPFDEFVRGGTLLVASDGLWKFLPEERMQELVRESPPEQAAKALIDAVRPPNGALQDDVSVVLASLPGWPS